MLPNLIVIGAAKAGTTSLHRYLDEHPNVHMSRPKELQFFDRSDWHERVEWYERRFPEDVPVRGESSPAYSMYPAIPEVPERMRTLIPEARILYLVRDPIDRLVAHYVEWFALGIEHRTFAEALADHDEPANPYVCASRYASQLERYLRWYPRARLMVLDHDDLWARRRETLSRVFSFLGVDAGFSSPAFDRVLNPRERKWRLNAAGWWLVRRGGAGLVGRMHRLPAGARDRALPLIARRVDEPRLDPGLREMLAGHLAPEARRLRAATGQPFSEWSV